jgi:hypothetical protein
VLLLNSASDFASVKFFLCVPIYQLFYNDNLLCSLLMLLAYVLLSTGNAFLGFVSLTNYINFIAVFLMYDFLYLHVFPCSLYPSESKVS